MNPNKYDDDAYLKASNEFQHKGSVMFEMLWKAGADPSNIIDEINDALAEAGVTNSAGTGPLEIAEDEFRS